MIGIGLAMILATAPAAENGRVRPGLWGWGLGLELPMVGLVTGLATDSRVGYGYNLGAALSWEAVPGLQLRAYGAASETYGGKATLRYLESVQTRDVRRVRQAAHWLNGEFGLGGAWLWRRSGAGWVPFAGGDLGLALAGYDFYFSESLAELEVLDIGDAFSRCTDEACRSAIHDAARFTWVATLRGGVRFELASWLASQIELALSYVPPGTERISNTVLNREVRSVRESMVLVRTTFSLWVGL